MPHLFRAHGFDMQRYRPTIGALIGSANHAAGAAALTEKMLAGTVSPLSMLEDAAMDEYRRRRGEEEQDGELLFDATTTKPAEVEPTIRKMVSVYRRDVVTHARPLMVERRLIEPFTDHVEVSGQGDLLALDEQEDGRAIVRDQKGSRNRNMKATEHSPQIGTYSLLFRSKGFRTDGAQIDFVFRPKVGDLQPPVEIHPIDLAEAEQTAHRVLTDFAAKAVEFERDGDPSVFIANPSCRLCSPKYCRFYAKRACRATYQGD
jgi:hypothetical protein